MLKLPTIRPTLLIGVVVFVLTFLWPFLGAIYVVYRLSDYCLGHTRFQKIFLAFLCFLVGNAFVYELLNAASLHPNVNLVFCLYIFICLFLAPKKSKFNFFSLSDLAALAAGLISVAFLVLPVKFNYQNSGSFPEATLHILSDGEDNASHYALFKYDFNHNGYAYSSNVNNKGLITSLVNYPQGSELNAALLAKSIIGAGFANNDSVLIEAYFSISVFFFGLLVVGTVLCAAKFYESKNRITKPSQASFFIVLSFGLITLGPLLASFARGFQSQIVAYVFLIGMLFVLATGGTKQRPIIFLAALMWAGVSMSWWFLAPVATAPFLINLVRKNFPFDLRAVIAGAAIVVLALYPVIVGFSSSKRNGLINATGGIDKISYLVIILVLLGAAAGLLVFRRFYQTLPLGVLLVASLVFSILIGLYQNHTLGHYDYYYYKSVYTLIPLSAVAAMLGAACALEFIEPFLNGISWEIAAVVVLLGATSFKIFKPVYPRVYAHDWYANTILPSDFGVLLQKSSTHKYADFIYVGSCSNGANYIINRWAGALFLSEDSLRSNMDIASLKNEEANIKNIITNDSVSRSTYVYANQTCLNSDLLELIQSDRFVQSNLKMVDH